MADNWLQNRLSPVKKDTARWQELAQAIETFWQENFDDYSERLDSLKSIFLASRDDQLLILSELGKYYDIDLPDNNIPLAVIQRRMELFQKDTLVPLTESLKRACPGITVEWRPLYVSNHLEYDDHVFYTQAELERYRQWPHYVDGTWAVTNPTRVFLTDNETQFYLTSRGKIFIDETGIENPELIESTIRGRIALTKPLHIVFDGVVWCLVIELGVENGDTTTTQIITAYGACPVFCCYLILDGTWNVDGSRFLCADNGDIRYGYPTVAGPMVLKSYSEISSQVTLFATYLDGSLLLDGTWFVEPYPVP